MAKPLVEVAISADGSVFVREVDKATSSAKKLQTQVKDSGDASDKWSKQLGTSAVAIAKWGAATAAAAAAGTAFFIKSAIDQADAANILSQKLGITTEALSKLEYAAKLSDVSQQALEGGLKKLTVTLTAAQDPASKAAQYLDALGLSARELIALPADQQLGRIGDALNNVENQSQRAALAQKIFGKAGMDLLPVLAEGSAGIRTLGEEAGRLGVVISGDLAARAGLFNDNLDRLKSAASGAGLAVADQLLDPMNDLAAELIDLAQQKETAEGIATFITGIGTAVLTTANIIATTANVFRYLGEELAAAAGGPAIGDIARLTGAMDGLQVKIAEMEAKRATFGGFGLVGKEDQLAAYKVQLAELQDKLRVSNELESDRARALATVAAAQAAGTATTQAATTAATGNAVSVEKITAALAGETDAQKAVKAAREAATKAADDARKSLDELVQSKRLENALLGVSARDQARYRAQLQLSEIAARGNVEVTKAQRDELDALTISTYDTTEATKAHEKAMTSAAKASDPWADALQGAAERVDSAFVDMWKNIGSGFDSFADSLKDAFKQLLAELAHMAITRPILMQFSSALGLGGSVSGSGSAASLFGSLLSGTGGIVTKFMDGFKASGITGAFGNLFAGVGGSLANTITNLGGSFAPTFANLGVKSGIFTSVPPSGSGAGAVGPPNLSMNWAGMAKNAGAGFAGGAVGNFVGSNVLSDGRQAQGSEFTTIGATIGSYFTPIGTAIGAAIGALIDVAFGTDNTKRVRLGITAGEYAAGTNVTDSQRGASGLLLQSEHNRTDDNGAAAKKMMDAFLGIDGALTAVAESLGITVDFSKTKLVNPQYADNNHVSAGFFGTALNNKFDAQSLKNASKDFITQWLNQIKDDLPERVKTVMATTGKQTAEEMLQTFGLIASMDKLLKLDVLKDVATAAAATTKSLLEVYADSTDAVVTLAHEYTGSVESMTSLTDALISQKQVAAALAVAYEEVSRVVDATFGNAINTIEESMLSEADLYQRRRSQIASLTDELSTTIDPAKIAGLVQQIDALAGSAFQMLDETQRQQMSQEFVDFLTQAQTIADQQIQAGRDSLAGRETATANAIDLEVLNTAALTQQTAANTFAAAVTQFAGVMGGGGFAFDPAAIAAAIAAARGEVNA